MHNDTKFQIIRYKVEIMTYDIYPAVEILKSKLWDIKFKWY